MIKLLKLSAILGFVAGCAMDEPASSSPATLPDASVIRSVAVDAYQHSFRRAEADLRIGTVQQVNAFIGTQPDFFICVSTTEKTVYSVYDNSGNMIAPVGTLFRQSYVMQMREYPWGWGSGIFRRVEEGKIGLVRLLDVCPPSDR